MKFGPVPVAEAEGAILAHGVRADGLRLAKAHRITAADVAALKAAQIAEVVAARLEPGDLSEDEAAARLAASLRCSGVTIGPASTGRVNIHADHAGLFRVDAQLVDAFNLVDPAITIATLADFAPVEPGALVATVKIIPFGLAASLVAQAERIASSDEAFSVAPFKPHRVALIQSTLTGTKTSVLDKTARLTVQRLARSGSHVASEMRVIHEAKEIAHAIEEIREDIDLIVIFGASAVSDDLDAIPEAIRLAGGDVERTGMPVDPGNLLVLGDIAGIPVIGAPGCARSPKVNGFDWVLDRLLAGVHVTASSIAAMGVGGLLMEIPTRPRPREKAAARQGGPVWGLLMAAGRSTRMGGPNKLLADLDGTPLVRRSAEALAAAPVAGTICVVGHQAAGIRRALDGLDLEFTENPDFASGLSTSLKAGIAALPPDVAGALICLGDMPAVAASDLARMVEAFRESGGASVVRATHNGKRGNPVLLPAALFSAVASITGDTGARHIIEAGEVPVVDLEIGAAASLDIDTPQDLENLARETR
ncbi:MAG: NTP transferase domain-containing protein [Rhizobiaceae bacterium]